MNTIYLSMEMQVDRCVKIGCSARMACVAPILESTSLWQNSFELETLMQSSPVSMSID